MILRQTSTPKWMLCRAAQPLCVEIEKALEFLQLRTLIRGHYHHCLMRSSSLLPLGVSHSGLLALRPSMPSVPLAESPLPASQDCFSFWTVLRLVLHSFPLLVKGNVWQGLSIKAPKDHPELGTRHNNDMAPYNYRDRWPRLRMGDCN